MRFCCAMHGVPTNLAPLDIWQTRSDELNGFISLPFSALLLLLPALKSGGIREILMSGDKLRYRKALLKSVSFSQHFDPEEI